ncbi:MAG: helix-turn-helix domain-containing protein [Burkholderiales bacterium]
MGLTIIQAVIDSKIDPAYRALAIVLAYFAQDDGSRIFPSTATLARALGVTERSVYKGLRWLIARGILQRDGFHGHTRQFRLNRQKLWGYDPEYPEPQFRVQPCTPVQGSTLQTLNSSSINREPQCTEPCTPVQRTLNHGSPEGIDRHDPQEEEPGANAPEGSHEKEKPNSTPLTPASVTTTADAIAYDRAMRERAERLAKESEGQQTPRTLVTVKTAESIGKEALDLAMRERDDSVSNINHHFHRLCEERHLRLEDPEIAAQAIVHARQALEQKARALHEEIRQAMGRMRMA